MFLDSKFDKVPFHVVTVCVDWLGFSHMFYTKMELINHFLQNYCLKIVLFMMY